MKKLGSLLVVVLAFIAVAVVSHYLCKSEAGLALAMFAPLLPRNIWGQPTINRQMPFGGGMVLNQGTFGLGGEELAYPIYDRMVMSATRGLTPVILFNTPVGQPRDAVALSYADTNIEATQVPTSQKFVLTKLTVTYIAAEVRTQAEMVTVLDYVRTTSIRFNIESKEDLFRLGLWKFFGTPQLVMAPAATITSRYPQAIFSGVWEIAVPITLESQTLFKLIIEPQVASDAGLNGDYIAFEFESGRLRKN